MISPDFRKTEVPDLSGALRTFITNNHGKEKKSCLIINACV